MKLITQRDLIRGVADKWRKQYDPSSEAAVINKWKQLDALDKDPASVDDVARIIGNKSWTRITCHECKNDVSEAVEVGEPPDYESNTAVICRSCMTKAVTLLQGGQ